MAFTPTEQDPVGDTKSILQWYDTSRPIFIDLVGEYAGKELFLVEGDSMLRECFSDERIDFQGKTSSVWSIQVAYTGSYTSLFWPYALSFLLLNTCWNGRFPRDSSPLVISAAMSYVKRSSVFLGGKPNALRHVLIRIKRLLFLGGFQLLHAVFVVERFLQNLLKRHCQFHIAFFDGKINNSLRNKL